MEPRKRRRKKNTGRAYVFIVMLAIVGVLGMQLYSLNNKLAAYKATEKELEEQLEQAEVTAQKLKDMEQYVHSDQSVEENARGKLGMIYDNEIIFREK